jgi:hypothetical protein
MQKFNQRRAAFSAFACRMLEGALVRDETTNDEEEEDEDEDDGQQSDDEEGDGYSE